MPDTVEDFLKKLHSSGAVLELLHSMKSTVPSYHPSSTSLCQALKRAWETLDHSKPCTHQQSGDETPQETDIYFQADEVEKLANPLQCEPGFEFWVQAALDYSWEQLHSGHWQDVKLFWREAYSLAALLNAFNLVVQGKDQDALISTDKGILLGAPILNHSLHCVATLIRKRLLHSDGNEVRNTEDGRATRKMGKVRFRNYIPQSLSNTNKTSTAVNGDERRGHLSCDVKDIPMVDVERRLHTLSCPSLEDFHRNHMTCSVPVVISGAMDHWPAYAEQKWK